MVLDDFDPLLLDGDDDGDDLFLGEFDETDSLPAVSGVPRLPLETTPPPPAITSSPPLLPLAESPPPLPLAPSLSGCDAVLPSPASPHAGMSCGGSPPSTGLSPPTPTSVAPPCRATASASTASLTRVHAAPRGVSLSSDVSMNGLAARPAPRLRARAQARYAPARGRSFDQKVAILEAFYGSRQPLKWGCWKETADRVGDASLSRKHVKDFMAALAAAFAEHRAGNDRPDVQLLRCVSEQATNHFQRAWRLSKFAPVAAAADAHAAADAVSNTAQFQRPRHARSRAERAWLLLICGPLFFVCDHPPSPSPPPPPPPPFFPISPTHDAPQKKNHPNPQNDCWFDVSLPRVSFPFPPVRGSIFSPSQTPPPPPPSTSSSFSLSTWVPTSIQPDQSAGPFAPRFWAELMRVPFFSSIFPEYIHTKRASFRQPSGGSTRAGFFLFAPPPPPP